MRNAKLFYEGNNFLLVQRKKGGGPIIIQTSGYTLDKKAIKEAWFITQLRTVPHRDRSKLPDPFIMNHMVSCYKNFNATIIELYIKPSCSSLEELAEEFANYYERSCRKAILIGHSKGGLIMTAALERIAKQTTAILIAPTFGTITGSESAMLAKLEENKGQGFFETLKTNFLKKVVKITSSRRPVDRDMYYTSKFVDETKRMWSNLKDHDITNIVAKCPEKSKSITTKLFIDFGKRLGLDSSESDGMVEVKNQQIEKEFVSLSFTIHAVHSTAIKNADDIIDSIIDSVLFKKRTSEF